MAKTQAKSSVNQVVIQAVKQVTPPKPLGELSTT